MLKLPYGVSNFAQIADEGYYFVDRTPYIAQLEQLAERYLFFLRPSGFGKTLFMSMLQCYYGLEYAACFTYLFGRFAIGQNPTPMANQYLVLHVEFGPTDNKNSESNFIGFRENTKRAVGNFLTVYHDYFVSDDRNYILITEEPGDIISRLFERTKNHLLTGKLAYKIYVIIDGYDHFANELSTCHQHDFKTNFSHHSFVRKFYESIKAATGDGIVDHIFITGETPVALDSLTSGFNIGKHLSLDLQFHNMMGFSEEEVAVILKGVGVNEERLPTVIQDLRQWYNGYLFIDKRKS